MNTGTPKLLVQPTAIRRGDAVIGADVRLWLVRPHSCHRVRQRALRFEA
jgi:hypothetical protein